MSRPRAIQRGFAHVTALIVGHPTCLSWELGGEVFSDRVIAAAVLDRILHHAITLNIRGNSYRLKDKLKAGLVRTPEGTE